MNNASITIVIIRAAGYAGATWVNLILGSHMNAMSMGPTTRFVGFSKEDINNACFVHREKCTLWPEFLKQGYHKGNLFSNLAKFTGKKVFIVNYPTEECLKGEIEGKGFRVIHVQLVRDGRANLHSKIRHDSINGVVYPLEIILNWQIPKWVQINNEMPSDQALWYRLKYEDLLNIPKVTLSKLSTFVGLNYDSKAIKFWEFEHHLTAGNTGVIDTLCRMQNLKGWEHHRRESYSGYIKSIQLHNNDKYIDSEWKKALNRKQLLAFDCLFGVINQSLGYVRDDFSDEERKAFWMEFRKYDTLWKSESSLKKKLSNWFNNIR